MADWQKRFLSRVILDRETMAAVTSGITPAFFRTDEYRRIYEFLLDHFNRYGTAADAEVVHQAYPAITWEQQKQPLSYLIEQMRQDRKTVILTEFLNQAVPHVQTDRPDEVLTLLQDTLLQARLETSASLDFHYSDSSSLIEERYLDRMENPGYLRGISTGFDGIDYVTGGLQPEQFVVVLGTPKTFKSATLLYMARAVHRQAKVPLFIGFEMSNVEQTDRLVSLDSGVDLNKIIHGRMTQKDFKRIQEALRAAEAMRPFIFSTDITTATTVSGVQAKVIEYQPDVVFIDGAYLMQSELPKVDPGSPQAMTSISRSLKRMAQALKIPVVVTTQASLSRSKGGLFINSAMYTQAWGQDCDIMLGTERQKADDDTNETKGGPVVIKFKVIESRSGPRKEVYLQWDWSHGSVSEIDMDKIRTDLDRRRSGSDDSGWDY